MEVKLVCSKECLHFTEQITDLGCHWSKILLDLKTVSLAMEFQGKCGPKNDVGCIIQHRIKCCQLRFTSEQATNR